MGVGPTVGSVALLGVGIFLNGVAVALGNVPLNVESARIERAMGRTVIPQFHAAFSIGAVTGSALGATASHLGVSVAVQFTAVAVARGRLAAGLPARARPARRARGPSPRRPAVRVTGAATIGRRRRIATALDSWREPRTLLIGVVVMAAALSEGSANDWLSLAVVDGFDQTEAVGGAMLAVFVGAMTLVRLLGTRLIDRFGRVAVLRVSGTVSIVGLLLFGFAPGFALAGVGIVLWGFGAALAVPVGIAAASDDPMRAAGRVAVVSAFASVASIAAPPLLGIAAASTGARHALALIAVAMVASVLLAHRVAPEPASNEDAPDASSTTSRSRTSPTPTPTRTARSWPGTPTTSPPARGAAGAADPVRVP